MHHRKSSLWLVVLAGSTSASHASLPFTNLTTGEGLGSNDVRGVYASGGTIYAATGGGLSIATVSAIPGAGGAGLTALGLACPRRRRR